MNKVCALVSGGLDSSAMLYELSKNFTEIYPLYIRFGLYWEKAELYWLKKFLSRLNNIINDAKVMKLKILKMDVRNIYSRHWSITGKNVPDENSRADEVYLPGRNILLLSIASVFCEQNNLDAIALGVLESNPFNDASEKFFASIEMSLSIGLNKKINLLMPFSKYSKEQLISKHRHLPLALTFSCINPIRNSHCGKCNKCHERREYFKK